MRGEWEDLGKMTDGLGTSAAHKHQIRALLEAPYGKLELLDVNVKEVESLLLLLQQYIRWFSVD